MLMNEIEKKRSNGKRSQLVVNLARLDFFFMRR